MQRVAIIGGGFTGTAVAIRLCENAPVKLRIEIVEPRQELGGGLAYGGNDPDHRVNGTHELLVLFPNDIGHFARWYDASGAATRDPEARADTGVRYVRRSDVRRYMNETLQKTCEANEYRSTIEHIRDRAVGACSADHGLEIELTSGRTLVPDLTVLAFGGQRPAPIRAASEQARNHIGYIADPFDNNALTALNQDSATLLIGTGLTAADVVATLSRQKHRGPIVSISRRGLLPEPQGNAPDVAALMKRLARPMPEFIERHGEGLSLRAAMRALRRDMKAAVVEGRDLKGAFDEARDAAGWLWPNFTDEEKRSFLRHLKPWYDVNRYRMVPQTGRAVAQMVDAKQLVFHAARLKSLEVRGDRLEAELAKRGGAASRLTFDTVINCTGPETMACDPCIESLSELGLAQRDSMGLGLAVDGEGRVLNGKGAPQSAIWAFGLLTRARFGDMTAIPQIAFRLQKSLPALMQSLATSDHASSREGA